MSSSSHRIEVKDVAVIVAAKNEEANIKDCIASILKSAAGAAEIIVVNDGSTDRTASVLEWFGDSIRVMKTEGVGPSVARNKAMQLTHSPYVAFADADSMVDIRWISSLVKELNDKDKIYVSIGGVQQLHPQGNAWDLFHASFLECLGFVSDYVHAGKKVKEVKHNPTCNVLYLKDAILEVDGFDRNLWPCEDLDLDIRLRESGKKFLFTPEAIIYHHRPDSFRKFMRMMFRYGFGHAQIVKKHGVCQKIHWMPVLIIIYGEFVLMGASRGWEIHFGYVKYLIVYLFLLLRSKSLIRALIYGLYLVPTVIAWNLGFITGLFRKMRITKK